MKVFVSSLIVGMEDFREAAVSAIRSLGHEPIVAEQFSAEPNSPRIACLSGVRDSQLVVLILGERYGAVLPSGISATHEEYREAKDQKPILAFVQEGVNREPAQAAFLAEVQGWDGGLFRSGFSTPDQLRDAVTRAIHRWELASAVAPVDPAEMLERARAMLPERDGRSVYRSGLLLNLAVAGGPLQSILRPSEIDRPELSTAIQREALFGSSPVFRPSEGTSPGLERDRLILNQPNGSAIAVDERGTVLITQPLGSTGPGGSVIIEEDVAASLRSALLFAAWLLDTVDSSQRLTRVVPVAQISGGDHFGWRKRAEHDANPNSYPMRMGMRDEDDGPVHLSPHDRARAALAYEADRLSEDLVVLLRRQRTD